MVKFANRVKVAITQNSGSWPGTGTLYLGSAAAGYQLIPTSLNGETIRYVLEHGTNWEIGSGTFNNSAQTLSRSLASSSTGSLLDIDSAANVFISPSAEDLQYVEVYSSTSDLPAASSNHGRIAHVHGDGDGAMYFAHGGNWVRLGNHSDITSYTLPTASSSTLGGIKIGTGLSIDGSGVVTASGSSSSSGSLDPITTTKTTATAGQTVFTGTWKAENISVFLNGVKLQDSEVTATDTQITISATALGDIVEVVEYGAPFASPYASTFPTVTTGATSVTVNYTPDKVAVYKNGVKLRGGGVDFTATNGTTITGFSAFVANDVVEVVEHGSLANTPNNILDLSDTPSSLGTAGQVLQMNSGANALEFADAGGTGVTVYSNISAMTSVASPSAGDLAYVTSNTSLYQNNGNGWYKIATINTSPAISSVSETTSGSTTAFSNNGTFALTEGANTVVTITASDADEGTDLTYSHQVTSGTESNVATITQGAGASENVFTFAPASATGGTLVVRFDVTDNTNTAQFTHSFSLSFEVIGGVLFTTTGTHSWTVPTGVTSVSVVCIGGGGSGGGSGGATGGSGGGLGYKNNISVTPGSSITVVVGAGGSQFGNAGNNGGDSYFQSTSVCKGGGGFKKGYSNVAGGTYTGDGGGNGGSAIAGAYGTYTHGGAGAGGYSGTGGHSYGSDGTNNSAGGAGSGGGGGGGSSRPTANAFPFYGGGTGVYGEGSSGAGGSIGLSHGGWGSGGYTTNVNSTGTSESYGGAAGSSGGPYQLAAGNGAVRVVWGSNRTFPSTNVGYADSTDGETTV